MRAIRNSKSQLAFLLLVNLIIHVGSGYPSEYATNNVAYLPVGKYQKKLQSSSNAGKRTDYEYTGPVYDSQQLEEISLTVLDDPYVDTQPEINRIRVKRQSDDAIDKKTIEVIADELSQNVNDVTLDSRLVEDLGADSLSEVECVMKIEQAFDIEIPDEEACKLKTCRDYSNYVKKELDFVPSVNK